MTTVIHGDWSGSLKGLELALDSSAMRAYIAERVVDAGEVHSLKPYYLRFKGQHGALVGWRLEIRLNEEVAQTFLTVRAAPLARLRSEAERFHDRRLRMYSGLRPVTLDEEHEVLLLAFPVDRMLSRLRHLVRLGRFRRLLVERSASPEERHERIGKRRSHLDVLRYKPERRAVLRWSLACMQGDACARHVNLYARVHTGACGVGAGDAMKAVRAHGVRCPERLVSEPHFALECELKGQNLRTKGVARQEKLISAGRLLAAVHAALPPTTVESQILPVNELDRVYQTAADFAAINQGLSEQIEDLAEVLSATIPSPSMQRLLHGDLHADQFLFDADVPGLVDFDRTCLGPAAYDLASFSAHATLDAEHLPNSALQILMDGYKEAGGQLPREELRWFEACALLRLSLAPLRRLQGDWVAASHTLVTRARQVLEGV